jgi:2-haloacid dehalogenase
MRSPQPVLLRDLISKMLDFSRFEILTFDCYGTLINWEEGILRCMHRILVAHGKDTDDATILQLFGDFEARAEQGPYRRYREVLQLVVREFGKQLTFVPTDEEIQSLPESLRDWRSWPDTVNALRELRKRFRLAIISNVDDDLFATTQPQLEVKFDQIITAQQAGAYKPSLKIFELALSRIGVPVRRILHVGQSIYHDIVPAQSLGLSTVWVNRPSPRAGVGAVKAAEGQADLTVSSLAQLVSAYTGQ